MSKTAENKKEPEEELTFKKVEAEKEPAVTNPQRSIHPHGDKFALITEGEKKPEIFDTAQEAYEAREKIMSEEE